MNRTTFIAGASGTAAALAGAATGVVEAQTNQHESDYTIRQARAQVAGMIAELQTEQADYGGHRANAIDSYKQALSQLNQALDVHGATPGQRSSDYVLRQVQSQTSSTVSSLNASKSDYGGHRVKAIADLQAANAELAAALATS